MAAQPFRIATIAVIAAPLFAVLAHAQTLTGVMAQSGTTYATTPLSQIDMSAAKVTPTGGTQTTLAAAAAAAANAVSAAGNGLTVSNNAVSPVYGTAANTIAQGNDARIVGALQPSNEGTAAGNIPVLGSGGLLPCAELPTDPSGTTACASGHLVGPAVAHGLAMSNGVISPVYGTAANTVAQGNDARIVGALQPSNEGTSAGNIPVLGTGGLLPCAELPTDPSGTTSCANGHLVSAGGAVSSASNGLAIASGVLSPVYGTAANTVAQGNDTRLVNALQPSNEGTSAGNIPVLGTGGLLPCAELPTDPSGTTSCANGHLVSAGGAVSSASNGLAIASGVLSPVYGTAANTVAQGNDTRLVNALQPSNEGTAAGNIPVLGTGGALPCGEVPTDPSGTTACSNGYLVAAGASTTAVVATGSTASRTLAARAADSVNIADYGAVPDMTRLGYATYTIAAGGTTLNSGSGVFNANMVGKVLVLPGAGANGAGLVSVISAFTNQGQVTLATAASTALSSVNETPEVGTDNTSAINAAIAAAESRTVVQGPSTYVVGSVFVPDGAYLVRSVNLTRYANSSLRIYGRGTLWGVAAGYPVVDALDSRWLRWDGVDILGDQYAVPSAGLQIGRSGTTGQISSDNNSFRDFLISGYFSEGALLNENSETTKFDHVHFYNNQAGTPTNPVYAVIMDGAQHFTTFTMYPRNYAQPTNTGSSFDENVFVNCIFGGYIPLWVGVTNRMNVISGYSISSGPYAVELFTLPGGDNLQLHLDMHMEDVNNALTDAFFLTGTDTTPYLEGFHWNDNGNTATNSIFKVDPASSIASVSMPDADVDLTADNLGATKFFNDPAKWGMVSGRWHEPNPGWMNINTFQGILSAATGQTDYSSIAPGPFQSALGYQGIVTIDTPGAISVTSGGHYYVSGTTYTPTVTFSAPPSGATATGHVSGFVLSGWGGVGNGGSGYTTATNVPVEDSNGTIIFYVNITSVNGGAITGLQFANSAPTYMSSSVPGTLAVTEAGGSGGTIGGANFAIAQATLDSAGSGYTSLPGVTFSGTNAAPAATGIAVPLSTTMDGPVTFSALEAHSATVNLAAQSITLPASGTAPTGATQLGSSMTVVTTCSAGSAGAKAAPLQLPAGAATGSFSLRVLNRSGASCTVYPPGGGTVESNGANVPVTIASGSDTVFVSLSTTAWDQ